LLVTPGSAIFAKVRPGLFALAEVHFDVVLDEEMKAMGTGWTREEKGVGLPSCKQLKVTISCLRACQEYSICLLE
jgi:hypothetical protein